MLKTNKSIILILQVKNTMKIDKKRKTTYSHSISIPYSQRLFRMIKNTISLIKRLETVK